MYRLIIYDAEVIIAYAFWYIARYHIIASILVQRFTLTVAYYIYYHLDNSLINGSPYSKLCPINNSGTYKNAHHVDSGPHMFAIINITPTIVNVGIKYLSFLAGVCI